MTKVIFLIEKDSASEVFAYFPENNGSYSHIGQHSGCSLDYVKECREAITNEYGYNTDSRQAFKTYKAVVREWKNIKKLFTPEQIEVLQEIN